MVSSSDKINGLSNDGWMVIMVMLWGNKFDASKWPVANTSKTQVYGEFHKSLKWTCDMWIKFDLSQNSQI